MASSSVLLAYYTSCILLCICSLQTVVMAFKPAPLHLTYYVHEIREGPNATLLAAAGTGQGNFSEVGWGSFFTFENFLKEGPTADSKLLGKITGSAGVTTIGGIPTGGIQFMPSQHIFNEASRYSGSSIILFGTFGFPSPPWESIVPGGTGYFRGYTGYALAEPVVATTVPPLFVYKWDIYLSK